MPLSKTLKRVFVDGYQVVRNGYLRLHDDIEQRYGTDDDVVQKYDSGNDRYVQTDRGGTDQLKIDVGNDLTDELEQGGLMELVIGNLLDFDPSEVIIDTRANQPADPKADAVQVVTDASGGPVIERYDGASWSVVAASAGALAKNGADPLDPTSLDGSAGNADQVLTTDGSSVSWGAVGGMTEGDRAILMAGRNA